MDGLIELRIQVRTTSSMSLVGSSMGSLVSWDRGVSIPSTKLNLFLVFKARVIAFCHLENLSPVRRPMTKIRLGESDG